MNASPVRLLAIPEDEYNSLLQRISKLEQKITVTDTSERFFKTAEVRRMFGNVSKQTILSFIQKGILHPKQFVHGGDYFFPKEEVLALLNQKA